MDIASAARVASLISASYGFFGNLGAFNTGVPPIVRDPLNPCGFTPQQRLRAWVQYVGIGHINFAPTGPITMGLQLLSAYLATDSQIRNINVAAGVAALTIVAFTLKFMFRINEEVSILDTKNVLEGKAEHSAEAKRSLQLIDQWSFCHRIREGIFGVMWGLVVWAVLLEKQL
ncbi:MAG: hypothetical protein M1820_009094 [Bogoriella megaspora]|nr:MAG: hypothetical protein M1820_009094 [Bogoriella megaspora]